MQGSAGTSRATSGTRPFVCALLVTMVAVQWWQPAYSRETTVRDKSALEQSRKADRQHHLEQSKNNETHTFKGSKTFRKAGNSEKELKNFLKNPQDKHVTTRSKGRLPTAETADKTFQRQGSKKVLTFKADDVKVKGKGHDKVAGAPRSTPEAVIAQKKLSNVRDVKIRDLKQSSSGKTKER